jgi:spore germination cell wall hydrolase CwlJ-like protein
MALCMWKEARGDGLFACRAVGWVIFNRVGKPGFAHTLHDVIYGKDQFSSMSLTSDPEFNLEPPTGDQIFPACAALAEGILTGQDTDCTGGALWYANLKTATSGWFFRTIVQNPSEHPQTVVIGQQTFFK